MFFLLGIATFSLLEKDIESEVLNEGSGCSSCSGRKHLKQKISQTKIKRTSPKSLLPSVPFKHIKKIIVIIPIKGTSTIKATNLNDLHHAVFLRIVRNLEQ